MSGPVGTEPIGPALLSHWAEAGRTDRFGSSRERLKALETGSPVLRASGPVIRILAEGGEGADFRDDRGQMVVAVEGADGLGFEEEAGADDLRPVEGIAGFEGFRLLMSAERLLEIPLP